MRQSVSVIVACYNEGKHIPETYERLKKMFSESGVSGQMIFVENGSTDESWLILSDLAEKDKAVTVVSMARNFGSQGAFTAGMDFASGDGVVLMDGDLQDPPELIGNFIKKWHEGFDIVYGVRTKRKGSIFRRIAYKIFYRVFRRLSYVEVPVDAGDFGLMDRKVVEVIRAMPERNRYLRGLRAWVGFRSTGVSYTRSNRKYGETTNSFLDNLRWAMLAIFSFSYKPLELISYLAFLVVGFSFLTAIFYVLYYLVNRDAPKGFSTLIVIMLFLGGIQLLCLSIVGQYLGRIFEEVKQRPRYIVNQILNAPKQEKP